VIRALWNAVTALVRSGKWPAVRRKHLEKEYSCQSCGRESELEVHHMLPVHVGGDELDADNLITFCHDCHFVVGHGCDWKSYRKDCRALAKSLLRSKVD
jgi:5-methylcytosine-specific restriction enzyme A